MVIKQRNIIVSLILSFVTCGIYGLYWRFMMAREAVGYKDANDGGILEAVLCIFLPFVGHFLAEKKFAEGCAAKGTPHKDNSILYLVLGIFCLAFVSDCMLQNDLNKVANA